MKTASTRKTPTGEITTISVDGLVLARFYGPRGVDAAKAFNDAATLAAENKRLRDALTALFEWGRSHISPTHNPDGHAAMLLAYEALNPKGNNQ